MKFQWPQSKLLIFLLIWLAAGTVLKTLFLLQSSPETPGRVVATFLVGLVGKFVLGAYWSGYTAIFAAVMLAGGVFLASVLLRGRHSAAVAYYAFVTIMVFSLFSIWIEPWLNTWGLVSNLLMILLGFFSIVAEIVVTIVWLVLWWWTNDELKREFGGGQCP